MNLDKEALYDIIVEALEQAAFRGEWEYAGETALGSAVEVAEIVIAALKVIEEESTDA